MTSFTPPFGFAVTSRYSRFITIVPAPVENERPGTTALESRPPSVDLMCRESERMRCSTFMPPYYSIQDAECQVDGRLLFCGQ